MSIVRMAVLLLVLLALSTGTGPVPLQAQDPAASLVVGDSVFEIQLRDGSTLIARVEAVDGDRIVLRTQSGTRVEVDRAQIRSVSPLRGELRNGELWRPDPNRTRLFFGPTGRSLRQGEGYVGAFELLFPFVAVGITDRVTLAGGTPILTGAMGEVMYLAPKVQLLSTPRAQVSTGVLAFFNLSAERDETDVVGIAFGAGTWGSDDRAVTLGAGWGFAGSDVQNRPAFLVGGETRVSSRIKLISENYLISYENEVNDPVTTPDPNPQLRARVEVERLGLLSAGVRFFGDRLAGDLGLGMGIGAGEGVFCCVPLVNVVYNFGRAR